MIGLTNWLSQLSAVTWLSLSTVIERKGASLAAVVGIAGVVGVFVGVLSIAEGFRAAMTGAGDPGIAMVLRSGSDTEMVSILLGDEVRLVADAPGVARGPHGPLVSPELFVIIDRPKRSTGTDANVPLRGVGPEAFEVRDGIRIVRGRRFRPGHNEVIVGYGAAQEFAGLDVGARLKVGRFEWEVVGWFTAAGGLAESEIWADVHMVQAAYHRGNSYQVVNVRLRSPRAFEAFAQALSRDPRLNVKVVRQTDFYAEQSVTVSKLITTLGTLVSALMALGAVFGALNTMYTAVAARTREIATLRALGFGASPILLSVLAESVALALVGGAAGGGIAYAAFDGFRAATLNWQSFSQVAFAFDVTPQLLAEGIAYAGLIGCVGGLFPALRAVRLPVAQALREL